MFPLGCLCFYGVRVYGSFAPLRRCYPAFLFAAPFLFYLLSCFSSLTLLPSLFLLLFASSFSLASFSLHLSSIAVFLCRSPPYVFRFRAIYLASRVAPPSADSPTSTAVSPPPFLSTSCLVAFLSPLSFVSLTSTALFAVVSPSCRLPTSFLAVFPRTST